MGINWEQMFIPNTPLLEIFIRGSIIYLTLFLFFRMIAIRVGGNLSLSDILVVVLIADGVQNGMAGEMKSVTEAIVLALTILSWDLLIDVLTFYSPPLRKILLMSPLLIVKDGRLLLKNMRKQFLSEDELMSKLRQQGVDRLSAVKEAYLEDDGQISFIFK